MNILTKKNITIIAYILIGLALILSFYLVVQRVNIEKEYNQVEIILNLTEVQSLANANNLSFNEMLVKLKENGATGILAKEISLGDLARVKKVEFFQGEEIKLAPYYEKVSKKISLSDANIFIAILDKNHAEQIIEHLGEKLSNIEIYNGEVPVMVVPVNLPNSDKEKELIYEELKAVGVGYDKETLDAIAGAGLKLIPQIRDWPNPTKESLKFMAREVKEIPNLSFLLFNDKQVPGYPDKMGVWLKEFKNAAGEIYTPVGMVEFFNQKGVAQFATLMNKELVRVHSIANNDMINYTPKSAIERFELAVSERNIRSLFVRFFNMKEPGMSLEKNLNFLGDLKATLEKEGFQIGQAQQFKSPTYSRVIIGFIGLGIIAGGVLLLLKKDWLKLGLVLGLISVFFWGGLLFKEPVFARKLMALASVIIYPTLSFLVFMREKPRNLVESIFALGKMSTVSLIGAVLMVGMLADKLFMLKLDQFVGVKLAHVLPLVLVPLLFFLFSDNVFKTIKDLLDGAITYRYALLAGLVAVALAIYVIRTGNDGTVLVSDLEEKLRGGLKSILGVRPRTKEFLIGHPFTLLILYFGLNKKNWFLVLPAIIGQVSLVNTYAHIHTPIIISLIRSINGLWIGIIFGVLLIMAVKLLGKLLHQYHRQ